MLLRAKSVFHAALAVLFLAGPAQAGVLYQCYQGGVNGTLEASITGADYVTAATSVGEGPVFLPPSPSPYQVTLPGTFYGFHPSGITDLAVKGTFFFNHARITTIKMTFLDGIIPTTPGVYALDDSLLPPQVGFQHGLARSFLYFSDPVDPDQIPNVPGMGYQFLDTVVITETGSPEPATCISFALGTLGLWVGVVRKRRCAQSRRA